MKNVLATHTAEKQKEFVETLKKNEIQKEWRENSIL
jgi:hypothetical protein